MESELFKEYDPWYLTAGFECNLSANFRRNIY